jgi:hypothetical protein
MTGLEGATAAIADTPMALSGFATVAVATELRELTLTPSDDGSLVDSLITGVEAGL